MTGKSPKSQTESDLESAISAAIASAFPRLGSSNIKHQIEFTIRLGHAKTTTNGRESWIRRGRADILLTYLDKPLAILELKKPAVALEADDGEQGLSYARLLPVMAPFVVVSNGKDSRIIETFTGQSWTADTPDAKAFEALVVSAAKVAAGDRHAAIATLMGSDPQVWTSAVAAASGAGVAELTATADHPLRPFGRLKVRRLATREVARKLAGGARLVLVSGPPLSGKTNVLEQLVRMTNPQVAGGLFLECGANEVFRKVADLLADTLDWPVDPENARTWMRQVSRAGGPLLLLAIDHLDPENRDDVRMVEDLTSGTFGPALRVVIGLDEDATRRALQSDDGRRESPIGRRAAVVEVTDLAEPEFRWALDALAALNMGIMEGGQHSPDLRQPWLLQAMATRLCGIEKREGIGVFPAVPGLEILAQARANFTDPELRRRYGALARAVMTDAQDQSRPYIMALQLTSRYFVRRATLNATLHSADVDWLLRQGYLTPSIADETIAIVTIALPELLASELARHLAVELRAMVHGDPKLAAEWLAGAASNFLFGDIVAAQAVLDLASGNGGRVPWALYDALSEMAPVREAAHAGQHLVGWVEGLGPLEIRPQEDGSAIVTIAGEDHMVEEVGVDAGSYANIHGWLILAQLASRRFVAEHDGQQYRLDPEVLLLVGTADFVLRQPRNDILMDSLPVHDTDDGGQFVCHEAGVVESVTQSILRYLNSEPREDRDAFIQTAMELDNIYLTARIDIALRMLVRSTVPDIAAWAEQVLTSTVRPAFLRHVEDH